MIFYWHFHLMTLSQTLLEDDNTIEHVYKRHPRVIYRYRYACISTRESGNCRACATPNIRQTCAKGITKYVIRLVA